MTNKMYSYFTFSVTLTIALFTLCSSQGGANYYGKFIGSLKQYHHGLQGDVYVVDSRTLHIRNFNYDGEGPAGYFYVSNGKSPDENGIKLRDERGSSGPLKRYRKKHITLTLPEGKTINNIKWLYVWCDEFAVNFGDVKIPKNLDFPKPQKIGKLSGVHSVSSDNIVIVDAQTLLIPAFSYDGEAPDAKFWVGTGNKPTPQGIRVPDENGKTEPLRKYDKKTIVLTLPSDITVFDIGNFAVWCEAFTVDFGHVEIPQDLNVPPSLKMLGVSPQKLSHFRLESSYSLYSELHELEPDFEANAASKRKIRDTFTSSNNSNNTSSSNSIRLSNTNNSNSTQNVSRNRINQSESLYNSTSTITEDDCPQHRRIRDQTEKERAKITIVNNWKTETPETEKERANGTSVNNTKTEMPPSLNDTADITKSDTGTQFNGIRNDTEKPSSYYTQISYLQNDTVGVNLNDTFGEAPTTKPNQTSTSQQLKTNRGLSKSRQNTDARNTIEIIQSVSTEYEPLFDDSVFKVNTYGNTDYVNTDYAPRPTIRAPYPSSRSKKNKNRNHQHPGYPPSRTQAQSKRAPITWYNSPQNRYTFPDTQSQSSTIVSSIIEIDASNSTNRYSSTGDNLIQRGLPFRSAAPVSEEYRTIGSSLTVGKIRGDNFKVGGEIESDDDVSNEYGVKEPTSSSTKIRGSSVRKSTSSTRKFAKKDGRPYRGVKKYRTTEKSIESEREGTGTRETATRTTNRELADDNVPGFYNNRQPNNVNDIVNFYSNKVVLPGQVLPQEDILSLNSLESV